MKIAVIADSHDNLDNIKAAIKQIKSHQIELVLHAGDFVAPFALKPFIEEKIRLLGVLGNNDGEVRGLLKTAEEGGCTIEPYFMEVELSGRRIALTHYPELAYPLAYGGRYDLVVFGHTHTPTLQRDGCVLLNPGELCGWITGKASLAIVELATLEANLIYL